MNANDYSAGYDAILKLSKKFDNISEEKLLIELAQYTAQNNFWSAESVKKWSVLVNAVDWWAGVYGCTTLSKIATPILNLPCSSAATERSFSTYRGIHNAKRNRLSIQRASRDAYVAQNLKLLDSQWNKNKYVDYDSEDEDIEDIENV